MARKLIVLLATGLLAAASSATTHASYYDSDSCSGPSKPAVYQDGQCTEILKGTGYFIRAICATLNGASDVYSFAFIYTNSSCTGSYGLYGNDPHAPPIPANGSCIAAGFPWANSATFKCSVASLSAREP